MRSALTLLLCLLAGATIASGAELTSPGQVTAGTSFNISVNGGGKGTFTLLGPATATKREVESAGSIAVNADEVEQAGDYTAILCTSDACNSTNFYVRAAEPGRLSLLVHPSRVPVAGRNAITAVALAFDRFHNLVLSPTSVEFSVGSQENKGASHSEQTRNGVAWIQLTSAAKAGSTKINATLGDTIETRVVEQVASEACNLRIKSSWATKQNAKHLVVETDPVRDCSGNLIPDGTVVSFTKTDSSGKTTVDAPIKKGIAKVEMPVIGDARISVASGVVLGNEISVAGAR